MKKPLQYISPETIEELRSCGPQTPKELVRFWLEVGFPEEDPLENYFPVELIEEVKQEIANEQEDKV